MSAFFDQQRRRWQRPTSLWLRHDAHRFQKPVFEKHAPRIDPRWDPLGAAEQKYSPSQPRYPAGNPRGGQWRPRNSGGGGFALPLFGGGDEEGGSEGSDEGGDGDAGSFDDSGLDAFASDDSEVVDLPEVIVNASEDNEEQEPQEYQIYESQKDERVRLVANDRPGGGNLKQIIAYAIGRAVIEAFRNRNLLYDLFGKKDGTVSYLNLDGKKIYGVNSDSPVYEGVDRRAADQLRSGLIAKYPDTMASGDNIGQYPNDAVYHAEATALLRAAREGGGSLAGRSLEVHVDRVMCRSCEAILPLIGLELGNPTVTFVDPSGIPRTMSSGSWIR